MMEMIGVAQNSGSSVDLFSSHGQGHSALENDSVACLQYNAGPDVCKLPELHALFIAVAC